MIRHYFVVAFSEYMNCIDIIKIPMTFLQRQSNFESGKLVLKIFMGIGIHNAA